jgi:hypothetical protein
MPVELVTPHFKERRTTVKEGEKALIVSRRPLSTGGYEVQAFVVEITTVQVLRCEYRVIEWLWGEKVLRQVEIGATGGFSLTLPPHELAESGIFLSRS